MLTCVAQTRAVEEVVVAARDDQLGTAPLELSHRPARCRTALVSGPACAGSSWGYPRPGTIVSAVSAVAGAGIQPAAVAALDEARPCWRRIRTGSPRRSCASGGRGCSVRCLRSARRGRNGGAVVLGRGTRRRRPIAAALPDQAARYPSPAGHAHPVRLAACGREAGVDVQGQAGGVSGRWSPFGKFWAGGADGPLGMLLDRGPRSFLLTSWRVRPGLARRRWPGCRGRP